MNDLSPIELGRWMDSAPKNVQDTITGPLMEQVIEQLGKKYNLHIDVAGLLFKLTGYMLLGYIKVDDFMKELKIAGVSDANAKEVMFEINQKIFVPLRAEMQRGAAAAPQGAKPAVATPQVAKPVAPAPRPMTQQNNVPVRPPQPTINVLNQAPRPPQQQMPRPPISNTRIAPLPPKTVLPDYFAPSANAIQHPMLPRGEQAQLAPGVAKPRPSYPPPPNLPGAMPPISSQPIARPMPPRPIQSKPVTPPNMTPPKPYSSDPYREPVE